MVKRSEFPIFRVNMVLVSPNFKHFNPYLFGPIFFLFFMQLFHKILSGMANSADPDQTEEQSDLGQHCLHMPFCQTL